MKPSEISVFALFRAMTIYYAQEGSGEPELTMKRDPDKNIWVVRLKLNDTTELETHGQTILGAFDALNAQCFEAMVSWGTTPV